MLEALAGCLRQVVAQNRGGDRPVLVIAGDGLGLAFATYPETLTLFGLFLDALLDPADPVCGRIVYVPGNHDHHLWELAREEMYARAIAEADPALDLPAAPHVTSPLIEAAVRSTLLTNVARRRGHDIDIDVVYPNLALIAERSGRCLLVHHGHYAEDVYRFFSLARRALFDGRVEPRTVAEIERQNHAWVDFVWSLLGRSGEAGKDFESLFLTLRNPELVRARADELSERLAIALDLPFLPAERLERAVIRKALTWYAGRFVTERFVRESPCSAHTMRGLERYVFGPSYRQLEEAIGRIPDEITVVFGHTHKPFERVMSDGEVGRQVHVLNIGGWTIDSRRPSEAVGAAILFASADLEVASLRVYNDGADGGTVALSTHDSSGHAGGGAFAREIARRVHGGSEAEKAARPWLDFGAAIEGRIQRCRADHGADGTPA